ncbi:MAG: S8 family serine peptidase [Bradyrhizobium sp.]|jgi:subtilisin family serine protease
MIHGRANWWMTTRLALALIALTLGALSPEVHAQSFMRSPNINIQARVPSINPSFVPRISPNLAASTLTTLSRTHRHLSPPCSDGYRGSECGNQPVTSIRDGGSGGGPTAKRASDSPRRKPSQTAALSTSMMAGQILAEIDGSLTAAQTDQLARRHGLVRLQSQVFPLIGATVGLFRISDRRTVEIVSRQLRADSSFRQVQPNFRYVLQEQKPPLTEGDPAQYALSKLRLPEAHTLATGANVTIAIIDSGVDAGHPELTNAVADSFDALGSKEGPHVHGTGVAGVIVAHGRLMGSAPAARILAIRAFGTAPTGAESTSFVVLKALDYAVAHGAQIVNMSFAGPKDGMLERGIAAAGTKGVVMIAASGNAGPKSAPLYPAANGNVIAVGATDAKDRLFPASNRGGHIAIAAPGVDIFVPAPEGKYQITSGTSFSAAYITGIAALMLERHPALNPVELRATLMKTARDLGAPGRDDLFGAGAADAYAAVSSVTVPLAAAGATGGSPEVSGGQAASAAIVPNQPDSATPLDKAAVAPVDGAAVR